MERIFWGDSHCNIIGYHFRGERKRYLASLDSVFEAAAAHLDFLPVAYYPFFRYMKNGLALESYQHHPDFDEEWEVVRNCVKKWNTPGRFVTFLGYEWHGNREKYGDHNVFYFDDGTLSAPSGLTELYDQLRMHNGIAIPHHTAYQVGMRGKDWDYFDETLSPFAEIYSNHGSSEGCATPAKMTTNSYMGPRTSGGSIQDGLQRGYHFGIVASSDNHEGFAGAWNSGLMAVKAKELTRQSLWEAYKNRRVYAVTGDRIQLSFRIGDAPMGSIIDGGPSERATGNDSENPFQERRLQVDVVGCDEIERIEILKNNRVAYTYVHKDQWREGEPDQSIRFKQRITLGWGPRDFGPHQWKWSGSVRIAGGRILGVETGYTCPGQKVVIENDSRCIWELTTKRKSGSSPFSGSPFYNQTLVFEIEAGSDGQLIYNISGHTVTIPVAEAEFDSRIIALTEETERMIKQEFGLSRKDIGNDAWYYLYAYKAKIHRAVPAAAYEATVVWKDPHDPHGLASGGPSSANGEPPPEGKVLPHADEEPSPAGGEKEDFYYIRVTQANGQMAWSSPIWVT